MEQVKIPNIKLNNGSEMPVLGYGTWMGLDDKLEFLYADIPKMKEAFSYAIDIGYRHIDTAHLYRVEPEIGEVVEAKIQAGVVKREELFITTKVWHHMHRPDDVEVSVRDSLRRLKTEYLDLVLMHWPMSITQDGVDEKIDYLESWRGFESVLQKGLVKSIGVSNFNQDQMARLLANCKVPPSCNQIEINLTFAQKDLVEFCQKSNVAIVAYSPFGAMVPSRSYPGTPELRIDDPALVALGKKYGKTVSQIVLRHLYQRGIVAIPKTVTKSRVLENASIFDFEIDAADVDTLASYDVNFRLVRPVCWQDYENYPFDKVNEKVPEIPEALRKWKNGIDKNVD